MSAENDLVSCPYNSTHKMLRKRFIPHLLKCRQQHPDIELKTCPFNQTHLVLEEEFVRHVTTCVDRKSISDYKYKAPIKEEEKPQQEEVICEDNWDNDFVEDYNPKRHKETSQVLRPDAIQPLTSIKNEEKFKREPSIESKDFVHKNLETMRPVTPPPPTGINWTMNSNTRDRSRSPIEIIKKFECKYDSESN